MSVSKGQPRTAVLTIGIDRVGLRPPTTGGHDRLAVREPAVGRWRAFPG